MVKRIAALVAILVILWCPIGQATVTTGTGDNFLNEGYIASGASTKELPQYLEYSLVNFHTKRNETHYVLSFKTEYYNLKNPSFSNEIFFTAIDLQINNQKVFSMPPALQRVSQELRMKTGEYIGDSVSKITSDNQRMSELISYLKEATTVKVRVSYNDGTQTIFEIPPEILREWQTQVIPYLGPL